LILLVFFFPLAIYLLILGVINRRRHPLLVSGTWDGIGLLFAASGFLLFAGPAVITSLSERWSAYWLFGQTESKLATPEGTWQLWIFLAILYFALVVGGAAFLLWRQRRITSIYNADTHQVERALTRTCEGLGLHPVRSGDLYLFGFAFDLSADRSGAHASKVQAPHYLPSSHREGSEGLGPETKKAPSALAADALLEQTAVLELDGFPLMHHVTLRWDPADSHLRKIVETELAQRLAETSTRDNALGYWLLTLGTLLLCFEFLSVLTLILLLVRR
jgi:hypothetical protein